MNESECLKLTDREQWYTNKEIFQILEDFKSDITEKHNNLINNMSKLELEITKTTTLIRDYNGLRSKINEHEGEITKLKTSQLTEKETKKDGRDWVAWIFGTVMFFIAIADRFIK